MKPSTASAASAFVREKVLLGMAAETTSKSLFTPTNAIFAAILAIGLPTMAYRFWKGLGAATQPVPDEPVGHLGRVRHRVRRRARRRRLHRGRGRLPLRPEAVRRPVLRPAILTGFLGYALRRLRPHRRPRPALAAPLPVLPHARHDRRHVRGRLVRLPVPDGPRARVPPGGARVARPRRRSAAS